MEEKNFQDYYSEIVQRDQKLADEKPLPKVYGTNVWTIFGLSLGITSIVLSLFTIYSLIIGSFALVLALIGYKRQEIRIAKVAIICSVVAIVLGIAFILVRNYF
jgi:hypothetical protein